MPFLRYFAKYNTPKDVPTEGTVEVDEITDVKVENMSIKLSLVTLWEFDL